MVSCPGPTDDPVTLTRQHLQPIMSVIWDARVKWRDIGGSLRVPYDTLEEIRYDLHLHNDGQRLEEVLRHWIDSNKAIIPHLLNALRSKVVHRIDIANKIFALQSEEERIAVGLMAARNSGQPTHRGTILFSSVYATVYHCCKWIS